MSGAEIVRGERNFLCCPCCGGTGELSEVQIEAMEYEHWLEIIGAEWF